MSDDTAYIDGNSDEVLSTIMEALKKPEPRKLYWSAEGLKRMNEIAEKLMNDD